MATHTAAGTDAAGPIPAALTTEAVLLLRDVYRWQHADAQWAEVDDLLATLDRAFVVGDAAGFRQALVDVEFVQDRVSPVTGRPRTAPPPRTRDRLNQLVHALAPPGTHTDTAGGTEGRHDRPGDR
ncbi:hypothetical protein O7632_17635 [Solwaraspora sp. WMMD406]|uniref:CATRA system-associated protein n=1 Tax=Solwaraspora sp. WMMD406 TaxID=3016095 RepID=UPI002417C160|nr:CATRA system-associated protein [Solwaraspora sp. WMMD406]MDG4765907.1 hypothetical protein [Solwaraspora sp. WMMD406]